MFGALDAPSPTTCPKPDARAGWPTWLAPLGPGRLRPLPPPPEEARLARPAPLQGPRRARPSPTTTTSRNDFYRARARAVDDVLVRGLASRRRVGLEAAQAAKHELICRKLGLEPGMRLLDVGCGWGGMVLHAAADHGVRAVGRHALAAPGRAGHEAGRRGGPGRPGRDPAAGLPRRRRRPVRRHQLDRHVRARRPGRGCTSTSRACTRCCARRAGC